MLSDHRKTIIHSHIHPYFLATVYSYINPIYLPLLNDMVFFRCAVCDIFSSRKTNKYTLNCHLQFNIIHSIHRSGWSIIRTAFSLSICLAASGSHSSRKHFRLTEVILERKMLQYQIIPKSIIHHFSHSTVGPSNCRTVGPSASQNGEYLSNYADNIWQCGQ